MDFWDFFYILGLNFSYILDLFCHIFWAYFVILNEKHVIFLAYFTYIVIMPKFIKWPNQNILQTTESLKLVNVSKTNITSLRFHLILQPKQRRFGFFFLYLININNYIYIFI
jgi:hypothetical protein